MASTPSAAAAAELAALTSAIKELFATTFIGFTVATTLYGVSVLQAYLYFRKYTKDLVALKAMVATLWIFDTLTTIFVAHSLFTLVFEVLNKSVNTNITWSFTSEKLLVTIITFISQIFYAHTIWKVSKNMITTVFISVLAVGAFGLGIYTTVHLFENPALDSISTRGFLIVSGLVQGLAALNDLVITGAMSWYLHIKRRGSTLPSTDKIVDTLILYAVSRGVLTAVAQIMFLVLNVAVPHHEYWLPFHMAVGKLYVNSVFATLNVRQSLSQKQTEIKLGPGITTLANNGQMGERDQTVTKPITFAPIQNTNAASTTFGTFNQSISSSSDVEQG
ncbi:hypothetical protein MSAN_01413600 [Mycena sanguinolenta]|uniref:DUF6534 domain-containing protein n=1 Tax=Mycena sanguinolenta TaxID=230812 RepID=A0A8H6YAS3_9AGAR|nr:hypothetical protein MSAN_01413600 [Mycena sanguinolenta]